MHSHPILTSLSLHWAYPGVLKEEPIVHLIVLSCAGSVADLVILVVARDQILHDGARLEEIDRLAVGEGVRQGGDASIGIHGEEPRLLLGVFADINLLDLVWNP